MNTARRFSQPPGQEALARFAATIDAVAASPASGNAPLPREAFHQHLDDMQREVGASGVRWRDTSVPEVLQAHVGTLDRCAYALDGLGRLLLASTQATDAEGPDAGLGSYLQEMLGYGITELAQRACRTCADIAELYPERQA